MSAPTFPDSSWPVTAAVALVTAVMALWIPGCKRDRHEVDEAALSSIAGTGAPDRETLGRRTVEAVVAGDVDAVDKLFVTPKDLRAICGGSKRKGNDVERRKLEKRVAKCQRLLNAGERKLLGIGHAFRKGHEYEEDSCGGVRTWKPGFLKARVQVGRDVVLVNMGWPHELRGAGWFLQRDPNCRIDHKGTLESLARAVAATFAKGGGGSSDYQMLVANRAMWVDRCGAREERFEDVLGKARDLKRLQQMLRGCGPLLDWKRAKVTEVRAPAERPYGCRDTALLDAVVATFNDGDKRASVTVPVLRIDEDAGPKFVLLDTARCASLP